ncbi:MAG TPA: PRC-barrel domain-containing protein [Rubrobacteraceae bacterium]|nr:PRC-barrel domain-containing protein [Rubrobacteraceae bacterium]
MASEERLRELEEKYEGYTVYDNRGERIGKVDDLFIDEADREEYIGVKMGFLGRKSTLIPMDIVRVNEADRAIEVSESKGHVKDAPSFDDDEDITPEYEERIRSHFGLQAHDPSGSRGAYANSSGAHEGRESDQDYSSREYQDRDASGQAGRAESDSSAGGAASRFERGSSTEGSAGSGESTEQGGATGKPRTRESEESETFEEGGRTKVRRRIIREEIIEEDA